MTSPAPMTSLTGTPPDLETGLAALDEALDDYEEAERYFEGRVAEVFSSARIRRAIAATGARYRFRLAKTPVQVLANRVKLAAVTVAGNDNAASRIAAIREANDMDVAEPDLILRTFEFGDAYMLVWPYDDDPDDPTDDDLATAGVEISYNSPLCMRVIYDEENPRRKAYAVKRWCDRSSPLGVETWRVDLYYRDRIERYVSTSHKPGETAGVWEEYLDADEDGERAFVENPYGEIPVFHFRTATPYGRPEHADAYGPQDALNKLLITQLTTTDSHGWPQRWRLTDKGAELDQAGDDPDWDDDTDAEGPSVLAGGVSTSQRHGPGTIQEFTGTRAVGQFAAADPGVFTDPVQLYVRLMAQVTDTPLHYFDPSGDAPSGESLKTANAPLDAKAENRQLLLSGTFREMWRFALKVAGVGDRLPVAVEWAPPDVVADTEWWATARIKRSLGVPTRQILAEANYRTEQLDEWGITDDPEPPVEGGDPDEEEGGQGEDDDG